MKQDDLDDELISHLEFQAQKHIARGMSAAEARRRARMEFGGLDLAKERCRDVDPWRHFDRARRNLKFALRSLAKSPAFTAIAIGILAVGIGSTVAVFGIVDALLYRPLAVTRPAELLRIAPVDRHGRLGQLPSLIVEPLASSSWLSGVCGFNTSYESAELNGTMSAVGILGFTGDCFRTLGVGIVRGRPLGAGDDRAGIAPVAVITGRLWRSAYGGRADVLGQRVQMPGASYTIVGVTDERFSGLLLGFPAGVIIPLHQEPSELPGGAPQFWWSVNVIGRRAPGVSFEKARAALAAQSARLLEQSIPPGRIAGRRKAYLEMRLTAISAATGIDYFLRDRFGAPLYAILGICAAILIIALVNLANLMLARVQRRRKEIAIRLALGGSRGQVLRMLALEGGLLVAAGAAVSILVMVAVQRSVVARGAEMFGNFGMDLGFDRLVGLFFAAVVATIGAAMALASALQARRLCAEHCLQYSARRRTSAGHGLAQRVLIAAQIALTLALVAGAGLFGSSLRSLYHLDLGADARHVWDVLLGSRPEGYAGMTPGPYYHELLRRLESVPGIQSAVLADFVPYYASVYEVPVVPLDGVEPGEDLRAAAVRVTDGFFGEMGMRMVAGGDFRREAPAGAEPEAIISQSLAERIGGVAALGRHIRVGTSPEYQKRRIVGIASDAQFNLADPSKLRPLMIYVNSWQHPQEQVLYPVLLLKTRGGPLPAAAVRRTIDGLGREYAQRIRSLDSEKDGALVEDRVMAYLAAAFGVIALILAAVGLFGLLSYQVANRTGEIGIRMALGARPKQIHWLILRQIAMIVSSGTAAGLALALAAGKAMRGLLFGVSAADPALLAGAVAVLGTVALLAAWLPARRAASIDPQSALRCE